MTTSSRTSAAIVLCSLLSGCVGAPSYLTAPAGPARPGVSFDGRYQGSIRITNTSASVPRDWCDTDGRLKLQVSNNNFTYTMPHPNVPGNPTFQYTGSIYPDGTIQGQSGDLGVITGRATGSHLEGVISGSDCEYAFTADRS